MDAQIIVFCVTAMLTKFYAELFQSLGSPVLEIHSRKSQSARTKAADAFRVGSQARFNDKLGAPALTAGPCTGQGTDYRLVQSGVLTLGESSHYTEAHLRFSAFGQ